MNSTSLCLMMASPDSPNVAWMVADFESKIRDIVRAFRQGPPTPEKTLAFESQLEACCREACRELVEREYNEIEPTTVEECPVRIGLAGEEYKRRPKSPNLIGTLFGMIVLRRYRYEAVEAGERGIFPLEMHLGVEAGLATPALAERIGLQIADHTQQQVLDWLERVHGIKWSPTCLRKVSASLSAGLSLFRQASQEQKLLDLLKKAQKSKGPHRPVLAVGRDGIMVPMRRGAYREASTATVSVMDRHGRRLGTVYLGVMPESGQTTLSDQVTSLLSGVLKKWTGERLRLIYVTDAGFHPRDYYEQVLQKMEDPHRPGRLLEWEWIVDFWHACCYLTKLREALFGTEPAGWKWFKRMRHWLRHRKHGVTDVLRSATQYRNLLKDLTAAKEELFWEGYNYLRKHARRMAYSRYRRQGKPIGSGITEAACKTVFTQRLKQSGMRWEAEGGQVVVNLRVLKLSGVWSMAFEAYQQSRSLPLSIQTGSGIGRTSQNFKKAA
jgi:hypothetical protein